MTFVLQQDIQAFAMESNRIEGIYETSISCFESHKEFLAKDLTVASLVDFVAANQPDAVLRDRPEVPGVQVGGHVAPPSGPAIREALIDVLKIKDPWEQHVAYETLHPFTDGNGRSGRAVWLYRHYHEKDHDPWAIRRGFLHSWYYHTLARRGK